MPDNTKRKSLEPTVFRVGETKEEDTLIGSVCAKCVLTYFPPREWCAACFEPGCKEVELSKEGTLSSFALVERKQAYCLVEAPYAFGEVRLPEGLLIYTTLNVTSDIATNGEIRVHSTIDQDNFEVFQVGQTARLVPIVIKKDDDGADIIAYNFAVSEAG